MGRSSVRDEVVGVDARLADRILDELASSVDQVALDGIAEIQRSTPAYAAIDDPETLEAFRAAMSRSIAMFFRFAQAGGALAEMDVNDVREQAVATAGATIPLDAVFSAVRASQRVLWDHLVSRCGETPEGKATALHLVARLAEFMDRISREVTEAYLEAQGRLMAEDGRLRRDLLEDLLSGGYEDRSDVRSRAREIGLDPADEYAVVLATVVGPAPRDPDILVQLGSLLGGQAGGPHLVIVRHDEVVGIVGVRAGVSAFRDRVLRALESQRWPAEGRPMVGIGTPFRGLEAVPTGYEGAQRAHSVASEGGADVVALGELPLIDHLLAGVGSDIHRMVPDGVRRLVEADERSGVLVETLLAYLAADLNVGRSAQSLVVHPNTVHYRLRRIAELTGRDTRSFNDLVELFVGLRMLGRADRTALC